MSEFSKSQVDGGSPSASGRTPSKQVKDNTFLKGLFEDRLMSMMRIRNSMEKIVEEQKNEEALYKDYMQSMLERSAGNRSVGESERVNLVSKRLDEVEKKYEKEFERRIKLQKAFINFKTEGNSIIDRLRFALRQISSKYKKEVLKNRGLSKKLNESLLNSADISDDEKVVKLKEILSVTNNELEKYKQQFTRIEDKFVSYKKMVLDHKKVINALRKKVQRLTKENDHLQHQLGVVTGQPGESALMKGYRNQDAREAPSLGKKEEKEQERDEGPEEEDLELKKRIRKFLGQETEAYNLTSRKDQDAIIRKLLERLEKEETQRLKTEEQSFKMVQQEEKTISFLENQIKNLTSGSMMREEDERGHEDGDENDLEGLSPIKETVKV